MAAGAIKIGCGVRQVEIAYIKINVPCAKDRQPSFDKGRNLCFSKTTKSSIIRSQNTLLFQSLTTLQQQKRTGSFENGSMHFLLKSFDFSFHQRQCILPIIHQVVTVPSIRLCPVAL